MTPTRRFRFLEREGDSHPLAFTFDAERLTGPETVIRTFG